MTKPAQTYNITHHKGQVSETVATGLTLREATNWLWVKAVEIGGWVSPDLIAKGIEGDESWSAVIAE